METEAPTARPVTTQSQSSGLVLRLQKHVLANFLPLAFAVAIIFAMALPAPGRVVGGWKMAGDVRIVQAVNQFIVFVISGLTLRLAELKAATRHWQGVLYGLAAILGITPCLAFAARALPLQPPEFATGLAIFSVMPTTLGVGVSLTAAAQGNQALAVFLTVATNLLAIATAPLELKLVLTGNTSASIDAAQLVVKLILTALVPTVIGVAANHFSRHVTAFVRQRRSTLTVISHTNLALIIWQTLGGAQSILIAQRFVSILIIIVCGILQQVIYILFNAGAVIILHLPATEAIAVLIMASQKSAPVAVTIIAYIVSDQALQGLLSVPAIIGQLAQVFIGSGLVHVLRRFVKDPQE